MVETPPGYMRRPAEAGRMAAFAAGDPLAAAREALGAARAAELARGAGLVLGRDGAVSGPHLAEAIVASFHATLRREHPDLAREVLRDAGTRSAERLIARQLSRRAQALLSVPAWPIAAWLLGRWAKQTAWTFAGSGEFTVAGEMEFAIAGNPLALGQSGPAPVCHWQESLFETLFKRLVDGRLVCRELECMAVGAPACVFAFALEEGAVGPAP